MKQRLQQGLSLIELMIALVIGLILVAGLVQVFSASRSAYQMAEGFGRVQENARFALDFLQRDVRMVGHMGCVNDEAREFTTPSGFTNSLDTTRPQLDFGTSVQGYEASGTGTTGTLAIPQDPTAGTWNGTPALPSVMSLRTSRSSSQ